MKKRHTIIMTLALATVTALIVGAGYAFAQTDDQSSDTAVDQAAPDIGGRFGPGGHRRPFMLAGEVIRVEGDSITITTFDGDEKTIKVNDDTKYRKPPDGDASLSDVTQGEKVAIMPEKPDDSGDLVARAVIIGLPQRGTPVVGEVVAVNGDTVTIRTADGDKEVTLPEIGTGMRLGVMTGPDGDVRGLMYNPPDRPEGAPEDAPAPALDATNA